jgi:hypothetical protein
MDTKELDPAFLADLENKLDECVRRARAAGYRVGPGGHFNVIHDIRRQFCLLGAALFVYGGTDLPENRWDKMG